MNLIEALQKTAQAEHTSIVLGVRADGSLQIVIGAETYEFADEIEAVSFLEIRDVLKHSPDIIEEFSSMIKQDSSRLREVSYETGAAVVRQS